MYVNRDTNRSYLLLSFLPPILVGILSSIITAGSSRSVYNTLDKPPLSPPGFLFPIVWTILYILMGVATYVMLKSNGFGPDKKKALLIFYAQLLVNFIWPIVFFKLELFGFAFLIILLLDFLVAITVLAYYRLEPLAGYLLIPYLIWILFATYLNLAIAIIN